MENLKQLYWFLGRKSKITYSNKGILDKAIIIHELELWGVQAHQIYVQHKILGAIMNTS